MLRKTKSSPVGLLELRRQDSNMRPPGYEPGELPTAPLRDVFLVSGCKGTTFFCNIQEIFQLFLLIAIFSLF